MTNLGSLQDFCVCYVRPWLECSFPSGHWLPNVFGLCSNVSFTLKPWLANPHENKGLPGVPSSLLYLCLPHLPTDNALQMLGSRTAPVWHVSILADKSLAVGCSLATEHG